MPGTPQRRDPKNLEVASATDTASWWDISHLAAAGTSLRMKLARRFFWRGECGWSAPEALGTGIAGETLATTTHHCGGFNHGYHLLGGIFLAL